MGHCYFDSLMTPSTPSDYQPKIQRARVAIRKAEHPGIFLARCYLKPLRISQSELARALAISRRRVNEIVLGQRGISADTAIRLSQFLDTPPMFWLEKQQLWDLYCAHRKMVSDGK